MTHAYTVGSLFAGIEGFGLGFERADFRTLWRCEIDPFCRKVIAKRMPEAEMFEDVKAMTKQNTDVEADQSSACFGQARASNDW